MSISRQIKAFILRKLTSKKSHNFDIHKAENVLFLRYDRIGDMVITTPVFRELKLVYPHIKITVLASTANQDVLTNNPYVDNIITNHKNNLLSDLSSLLKLRKQKFDVCIEFDHSVIPHAIIRLKVIKPKKVISVKKDGRYGVDGSELLLYDFYTEKPSNAHFRDIWLATLKPFGVKPKSNVYDLFITDTQQKQAQNFIKQYSSKFLVGINLEGAVKGKKIKFSELWQICQGLHKANNNIQVIILTTPGNLQSIYEKVTESSLDYVVTSYKT
ncbi:MAG TPA: lipopolysaccharide heptosyltransferase family protein, partial [Candidatus Marinimicrobia bacterium]|nr:lipopolysaccharide heptosyltransferase family protein [Candidatus Neomarinimicrobiota bacterium]